jgi:hypothetical protein
MMTWSIARPRRPVADGISNSHEWAIVRPRQRQVGRRASR